MNRTSTCLALALVVLPAGCDRAVDAAGAAREALEEVDIDALGDRAPEMLRALGERTVRDFQGAVDRLSNEESLRRLADDWAPVLEELHRIQEQLGGFLPGRDSLESVLAALRQRVEEDDQLRQALEPLMDRLEELLR